MIVLDGRTAARKYVDTLGNHQVHPMSHTLYPHNDAVFQDYSASIHTDGTVQSRLEEHLYESPHFTTSEPL
jgi:hypothetical protein